jgi:hypothetical protein
MRTFLALWCSLIIAIALDAIIFNLFGSVGMVADIGANARGNILFLITLTLICISIRKVEILSLKAFLGVIGFVVSCVAMVWAAPYIMPNSLLLSALMMSPIGVIGRYPPGADMDLFYGATAWGLSAFMPIGAGLLMGALLRRLMPARTELELR